MKKRVIYFLTFLLLLISFDTFASIVSKTDDSINWFFLVIGLLGGLALFLYGMEKMSTGMKQSAGNQMRKILSKLTNNRVIGLAVGAFVTMVIQSSSATTVMLVSFVQSGLMSFGQSLGVILGANVGTTVTAQLIAFKLTDYAILMIATGFALRILAKKDNLKNIGEIILGFGLLFYGMKLMSDAMKPLRAYDGFISLLKGLENPLAGVLAGLVFTALIQSSSAFTGIVIVLAQQNLLTLEAGIPMIMGANIGTCVTAGLASIGASREAKRVAIAHTFFNLGGALLFIFWIPYFADFVKTMGSEPARQIANAHTIFNISVAIAFVPFTHLLAKLVLKIMPPRKEEKEDSYLATQYLDENVLVTPVPAIDLAVTEIARASRILGRMLQAIIVPFTEEELPNDERHPELDLLMALERRENEIDFLENKISDFLIKISRQGVSEEQTKEIFGLMSIINDIESVGDIIYDEMVPMIDQKEALDADFTKAGRKELKKYHVKMCKQLSRLQTVFENRDSVKAVDILAKGEKYSILEAKYRRKHFIRIHKGKNKTLVTHKLHVDLFDYLKQIGVYLENIAKTVAETSPFDEISPDNALNNTNSEDNNNIEKAEKPINVNDSTSTDNENTIADDDKNKI